MSVTSITATRAANALPAGRYGLSGLLRSEWTKLRSVRSTMWTLGLTLVIGVGVSVIATASTRANWSSMSPASRTGFDPIGTSLVGVVFGQFTIGILGVLAMSAEYGTGTIRATFAAAPRRPLVLAAKAAVFGLVALVVSEIVAFGSFLVGQALLSAPATHATLSTPGAWRAVVGSGLFLCLIGLFSLGLATIIRHTAGRDQRLRRHPARAPADRQSATRRPQPRRRTVPARPDRRQYGLRQPHRLLLRPLDRTGRPGRVHGGTPRPRRSPPCEERRVASSSRMTD